MKNILNRINSWLLMTNYRNSFFEKRIRWQLHSFINYILYPEFRKSWDFRKIIYNSRTLIITLTSVLLLIGLSYVLGKTGNLEYIKNLKNNISFKISHISQLNNINNSKDSIINKLSTEVRSREYLEFKIIQEAKLTYIDNIKSVPDSIFFLMVSESDKYNIPYTIFFRVMEKESKFLFVKNNEGSSALGYMQVIESTFSKYYNKLDLSNGHTKGNNIRVAASLINSIHNFWSTKFKDDYKIWEYSLAEYGCGRSPMMDGRGGYFIPESVKPGINYVMREYKKIK